ncbi:MAG: CehA/McbA family metallohydrolase [Labilithrix sp.]
MTCFRPFLAMALLTGALPLVACAPADGETASSTAFQTDDGEGVTRLTFDGEVPSGGLDHFFVPFDVPAGTAEIQVRHDTLDDDNIIDWGIDDAAGTRGWGGGTSKPAILNAEAASPGYVRGAIKPGRWRVIGGKAKIEHSPAKYHVEIELRTKPTLEAQHDRKPYAPRVAKHEARWYAGDFHVHSRDSTDATPSIDEIAVYARAHGLDFVEISDHNVLGGQDYFAEAAASHPDLLLLPGVEYTTYAGHANGIGATRWVDHKIGQPGVTIDGAVDAFHQQGALFSINHPKLDLHQCIGCEWRHDLDGAKIDAVEIANLGQANGGAIMLPGALGFWDGLCARGHHAAALGGSDDHRAGESTGMFASRIGEPVTMVYAEELSAAGILEGIRNNRTVVKLRSSADPMVDLTAEPGTAAEPAGTRHIRAKVTGLDGVPGAIVGVRLVKNALPNESVLVPTEGFTHDVAVTAPATGEDRYRAEVLVNGQLRTITSNVFVRR